MFRLVLYAAIILCTTSCAAQHDNVSLRDGMGHVSNFSLFDQLGILHELYYYSDKKAIVLIAQGNGCPIVRKEIPYVEQLRKEFEAQGVVFLMINANPQDDRQSINQEVSDFGIFIPILEDKSQAVAASLHINRTAQAVVISPKDWSIVYNGAINNQFGYETQQRHIRNHYLREALTAILSGRKIERNGVMAKGCLIHFESEEKQGRSSYVRDIAPILINKCIACHSPGGIAPWSMDNYNKVKGWGAMIDEVVRLKRMPPWGADSNHRPVKEGTYLSDDEVRRITQWVDEGMPRGEGEDSLLSAPRPSPEEWPLGKPDLILTLERPQDIPATGVLEYRNVHAKQMIAQDQWVRAIYWKPGSKKAVHHAILYALNDSKLEHPDWFTQSGLLDQTFAIPIPGEMDMVHAFDTYVPGQQPFVVPESTGMYVPKGTRFMFQLHYTVTGKKEEDDTQVGLYFYKEKPPHVLSFKFSYNHQIRIPPRQRTYLAGSTYTFSKDTVLYAIRPHMHSRGRSVRYELEYPNGSKEEILSVAHYRFLWQLRYEFKQPVRIPAGTKIYAHAVFDNSAQNPDNPNPDQWVTYGMLTENDMLGSMYYVSQSE